MNQKTQGMKMVERRLKALKKKCHLVARNMFPPRLSQCTMVMSNIHIYIFLSSSLLNRMYTSPPPPPLKMHPKLSYLCDEWFYKTMAVIYKTSLLDQQRETWPMQTKRRSWRTSRGVPPSAALWSRSSGSSTATLPRRSASTGTSRRIDRAESSCTGPCCHHQTCWSHNHQLDYWFVTHLTVYYYSSLSPLIWRESLHVFIFIL